MSIDALKKAAAEKAVERVKSDMVLGLGSGSTTRYAVIKIGQLWQAGAITNIVGIPTSERTAALASEYDIPLGDFNEYPNIDLTIDGADEVDPQLNLIKGLGGALLREKMIAAATNYFMVVVDGRKLVAKLGAHTPVPVEVVQFGWKAQARWLESLGCTPTLRGGESQPFITDNGNYILDCAFPQGIDNPAGLAITLKARPGVVEHGLFLGMAHQVIVAEADGFRSLFAVRQ